jgi:ATP-dependent DNA helicase RecQ
MPAFEDPLLAQRAEELLRALAGPDAVLRQDQAVAIAAVVERNQRVLVVQATGWGKSAVYFIASKLAREAGRGPTLVVSPLLALMRDQVRAAASAGIAAATVNSANVADWDDVFASLHAGTLDLLVISPERFANAQFRDTVLPKLLEGIALVVVDEAHCVSDWGHDFRPHYRRIRAVVAGLQGVPVLACTATANGRVVTDVAEQLGDEVVVLRGNLDRQSLHLGVVNLPTPATRVAWIAARVAEHAAVGVTGIVYTLTQAQAEQVAAHLVAGGIAAAPYHGGLESDRRGILEDQLRDGELTCLVATSALGMGFDARNVGFVHHLGLPPSPVAYYQAIGRAGRALPAAEVVALPGAEDRAIWSWMSSVAMPPERIGAGVLEVLRDAGRPMSDAAIEVRVDISRGRLGMLLNVLDVDGVVERVGGGWVPTGRRWVYDRERYERIAEARGAEAEAMVSFASDGSHCRLAFLRRHLDDITLADPTGGQRPDPDACGRCDVCAPGSWEALKRPPAPAAVEAARIALGAQVVLSEARRMWPSGLDALQPGAVGSTRPVPQRKGRLKAPSEAARVLARPGDGVWADTVAALFAAPTDEALLTDVVGALAGLLRRAGWPAGRPTWVTWVPSRIRGGLNEEIARQLAALGKMHVEGVVVMSRTDAPRQSTLSNSAHRAANALATFTVAGPVPSGAVLLVDDVRGSGWTATVVADALAVAGAGAVYPLALTVVADD